MNNSAICLSKSGNVLLTAQNKCTCSLTHKMGHDFHISVFIFSPFYTRSILVVFIRDAQYGFFELITCNHLLLTADTDANFHIFLLLNQL